MKLYLTMAFVLAAAPLCAAPIHDLGRKSLTIAPLVDMRSHYLLGGSVPGRAGKTAWRSPAQTTRFLSEKKVYRLYSATRFLGQGMGSRPVSEDAPCPDTLAVQITSQHSRVSEAEFAVGGDWNALPRVPHVLDPSLAVYRREVAQILQKKGIAQPHVKITQLWRVDLDGDGTQEVLLTATDKYDDPSNPDNISPDARAGQYSLALLRKIVQGKVKTIILAGDVYPQAKTFVAPSFWKLAAALDLDGDGTLEIILRGHYYEGDWTSIYSVRGDKKTEVLSAGCGA